jgi:alkanesulfonate monooxygenase SsuD/methylene tetrahydromethanopterin reductase-like flavin-dependent oxidoreductase (luciferase family)
LNEVWIFLQHNKLDHKPYNQLLDETKEITTYCDQNNWDSIWYTEHHFNHEGMESCTNPLMMGVDAAARTKQIRIGQACNVITFHNPIRLAEDIALLDQLSNGRVEVGIGRGIYGREAINMNKEADLKDQAKNFRLFEESLTIMKKAWTEEFFSHQGEFYTYPSPNFTWQHDMSPPSDKFLDTKTNEMKKISIVPKPKQNPHPPIWQVVDGARSIEWAAQNGLNTIMWIPTVKALKKDLKFIKKQSLKQKIEMSL